MRSTSVTSLVLLLALVGLTTTRVSAWKRPFRLAARLPSTVFTASGQEAAPEKHGTSEKTAAKDLRFLPNYVTRLFNEADTNHDGGISPSEVYELVLKFYVKVNQQAPVSVPSRERVMTLFRQADTSRSGRLEFDEFRRLMRTLYARVSSRVVAFKVIKMVCAPVLAIKLVDLLKGNSYLKELFDSIVPETTPNFLVALLTKESFWSSIFTLLLVVGLGKAAFGLIDWLWWGRVINNKDYDGCDELLAKD